VCSEKLTFDELDGPTIYMGAIVRYNLRWMSMAPPPLPVPKAQQSRNIGRYAIYDEIASGGMATVHFGRLLGAVGFSRTVAIKHLLPHYSHDAEFLSMFLDEARLAARIQHPNVTVPLDVIVLEESEEIFLIMEYIHGDTLGRLLKGAQTAKAPASPSISATIMSGALHGLHAAHEATNEIGVPLNIVHRDMSPQNIMVGVDGVARVLDFGVAKAVSRLQSTRQGQMKGKLAYMAPEQVRSGDVDRRLDIFAAGIVLWESLTLRNLFKADDPAGIVAKVLTATISPPSSVNHDVPPALDRVVMKALERNPRDRFQTARDFASAIEESIPLTTSRKVGEWVAQVGGKALAVRAERLARIESSSFEGDSPGGPEQVFRSRRTMDGSFADAHRTGEISSNHAERSGSSRAASLTSGTGMGELLPSSPVEMTPMVRPSGRSLKWPVVASASLLVAAVAVGAVWLSSRTRIKAVGELATQVPQVAAHSAVSVTTSHSLPETGPAVAAVRAPTQPGAATPTSEESASVASQPAVLISNTKPKALSTSHRSTAKPVGVKLQTGGKPRAKKDCNPPYYIDPNGIRRVKDGCL
jgi:eukaryotic-like serine/threonine-protein kinase